MRRALAAALVALAAAAAAHGQSRRDEESAEILTRRAEDPTVVEEKRAEAFVILASRKWQCAYDVTERKENRRVVERPDRILIRYRMPARRADFFRARECADEGLRLAERAVALAPKNPNAWSYRANLLREAAKLAEMKGDAARADEYNRRYEASLVMLKSIVDEARRAAESGEQDAPAPLPPTTPAPSPTPTPAPTAPKLNKRRGLIGSVLNHKAVYKPAPEYPAGAKAAGVEGVVIVDVSVDEAGNVVSAEALSGPAPLREAAERAARAAKFPQTLLSGRPVAIAGVLTYKFALP